METPNKLPEKQPKDKPVIIIQTLIKSCYREHKFKEGDPKRECSYGFKEIDLIRCMDCRWYQDTPGLSSIRAYDDPKDMQEIATALHGINEKKR